MAGGGIGAFDAVNADGIKTGVIFVNKDDRDTVFMECFPFAVGKMHRYHNITFPPAALYDIIGLTQQIISNFYIKNLEIVIIFSNFILHAGEYFHKEVIGDNRDNDRYNLGFLPGKALSQRPRMITEIIGYSKYFFFCFSCNAVAVIKNT